MANGLKRFGGILSIVALLVLLAWTPGEAGLGGISRTNSAPTVVVDSGDTNLPWYVSLLSPLLTLASIW